MNSETISVSLTIAATIISVYNTVLFYRQSRLVEKQTLIQRSRVYPHVRIREANVVADTFKLALENMSEAPAFRLGLMVAFIPCSPGEKHWQFIDEITWTDHDKMKKGYPRRIVVPIKNKRGLCRLYGEERDTYEATALFLFSSSKKGLWEGQGKADHFKELKTRLMNQDIRFVAVMTSLVYKDVAETVDESEQIKDFIVDFQKHDSLEQAWEESIPFYDKTIGYEKVPFMDYEFYRHAKGYRSSLEPFR